MGKRVPLLIVIIVSVGLVGWLAFRLNKTRHNRLIQSTNESTRDKNGSADDWNLAVEKAKAARGAELGGSLVVPPELKHYEERYWFLATQVAEIEKYQVHTCQDYLDLAAMLERHELVPLPAVTDTYVLLGIGQRADDDAFSPFDEKNQSQFKSLENLAKSFNGRSFDVNNPSDRYALKVNMLSSVRPEALKVLEEIAASYHQQFDLPLPVSSLIRPEQYQHSLKRVNRNAVVIESPPHSTGLAFDLDYRYMSVAEQSFLMRELARIKNEGRIEVIRERNANYHVFAFINGARPSDDLITASLEKAGAPPPEAHHPSAKAEPRKSKATRAARSRPRAKSRVTRKHRRR